MVDLGVDSHGFEFVVDVADAAVESGSLHHAPAGMAIHRIIPGQVIRAPSILALG